MKLIKDPRWGVVEVIDVEICIYGEKLTTPMVFPYREAEKIARFKEAIIADAEKAEND
jgi:hypothetical protein